MLGKLLRILQMLLAMQIHIILGVGAGSPPSWSQHMANHKTVRWAEAFQCRSWNVSLIPNLAFFSLLSLGWRLRFGPTLPSPRTPVAAACHPITATSSSSSFELVASSVSAASLLSSHSVVAAWPVCLGPFLPPNRAFLVPAGTPGPLGAGCGNIPCPSTPQLRSYCGRRFALDVCVFGRQVGVPLLGGHLLICSCWNQAQVDMESGTDPKRTWGGASAS